MANQFNTLKEGAWQIRVLLRRDKWSLHHLLPLPLYFPQAGEADWGFLYRALPMGTTVLGLWGGLLSIKVRHYCHGFLRRRTPVIYKVEVPQKFPSYL